MASTVAINYKMKCTKDMVIRDTYSTSGNKLGVLTAGTVIIANAQNGIWYKHDKGGWSCSKVGTETTIVLVQNLGTTTTKPVDNTTTTSAPAKTNTTTTNVNTVKIDPSKEDKLKAEFIDDRMKRLIRSSGIYDRSDIQYYSKFNRFGAIDPYNVVANTREYLFFTRPDLHIYDSDGVLNVTPAISDDPFFIEMHDRYRHVLEQWQKSVNTDNGPFMNLLSNTVKNPLDMPSINTREVVTSANIYGTTISYPAGSIQSDEAHEFSLEFEDTRFLEIYMLFKIYEEYQRKKSRGTVAPKDGYIERKILHDHLAIYKFIVMEDAETILYYAKLTGCYPKSTPREAFSDPRSDGGLRYNVNWIASFVEDMNPIILREFNYLIKADQIKNKKDLQIYDNEIGAVNGDWATIPYIAIDNGTGSGKHKYVYKLRWKGE